MPPRKPLTTPRADVSDDAALDHRRRLVALRDRLTEQLDVAPVAYTAGIARQLQSVLSELANMPDPDAPMGFVDQLRLQRLERFAEAGITPPESRGR